MFDIQAIVYHLLKGGERNYFGLCPGCGLPFIEGLSDIGEGEAVQPHSLGICEGCCAHVSADGTHVSIEPYSLVTEGISILDLTLEEFIALGQE
jgi:hypothetical protein